MPITVTTLVENTAGTPFTIGNGARACWWKPTARKYFLIPVRAP